VFADGRSEKPPVIDLSREYPRERFTTTSSSDGISNVITGLFGDDDAVLRTVMLGSEVAVPHSIGTHFHSTIFLYSQFADAVPEFAHPPFPKITLDLQEFAQVSHVVAVRTAALVITKLFETGHIVAHPKINVHISHLFAHINLPFVPQKEDVEPLPPVVQRDVEWEITHGGA
jgi:hypothetical protein